MEEKSGYKCVDCEQIFSWDSPELFIDHLVLEEHAELVWLGH